ncbi:MAG: Lrp/AsnC ligand binding domain-containing protein [Gammaproteobacteria bacterium]
MTRIYLLRVVVPDLDAYQRFLMERLTRVPERGQYQSPVSPCDGCATTPLYRCRILW